MNFIDKKFRLAVRKFGSYGDWKLVVLFALESMRVKWGLVTNYREEGYKMAGGASEVLPIQKKGGGQRKF